MIHRPRECKYPGSTAHFSRVWSRYADQPKLWPRNRDSADAPFLQGHATQQIDEALFKLVIRLPVQRTPVRTGLRAVPKPG